MIRNFEESDLDQVLNLAREIREYHIDLLNGYFKKQDDEIEKNTFLNTLHNDKTHALVAIKNNKVVGYLLAEFKEANSLINPQIAHISNFGVTKTNRKNGIGKKLMDAFFEICKQKKITEIKLGVYNKNTTAYKFYENYGFKPIEQKMSFDLSTYYQE